MAAQRAEIRIGISGWTYAPWRGQFFPKGLPRNRELAYASTFFRSIEINGTFYGLQTPSAFRSWAEQVPEDFVFAVKAPRFITHIKRARNVAIPVANFFASGVLALGAKLGPVLWQFPPNFHFDQTRMEEFLALLPHDTGAASALARRHDRSSEGAGLAQDGRRAPPSVTRSKSATRASSIRLSSICCGRTMSRWFVPIRSNGRGSWI